MSRKSNRLAVAAATVACALICVGCVSAKGNRQVRAQRHPVSTPAKANHQPKDDDWTGGEVHEIETVDLTATPIIGKPVVNAEQMYRFVKRHNPKFNREIAEAFYEIGKKYGVRGDIALCQSILETGWFQFGGGTAVKPAQHNYCGLGVTRKGVRGHSFKNVRQGVTAQIQHLYAYATKSNLPHGEKLVDPRFSKVKRGIAPTWGDLNNRWAMNSHYADRIMKIYTDMLNF